MATHKYFSIYKWHNFYKIFTQHLYSTLFLYISSKQKIFSFQSMVNADVQNLLYKTNQKNVSSFSTTHKNIVHMDTVVRVK